MLENIVQRMRVRTDDQVTVANHARLLADNRQTFLERGLDDVPRLFLAETLLRLAHDNKSNETAAPMRFDEMERRALDRFLFDFYSPVSDSLARFLWAHGRFELLPLERRTVRSRFLSSIGTDMVFTGLNGASDMQVLVEEAPSYLAAWDGFRSVGNTRFSAVAAGVPLVYRMYDATGAGLNTHLSLMDPKALEALIAERKMLYGNGSLPVGEIQFPAEKLRTIPPHLKIARALKALKYNGREADGKFAYFVVGDSFRVQDGDPFSDINELIERFRASFRGSRGEIDEFIGRSYEALIALGEYCYEQDGVHSLSGILLAAKGKGDTYGNSKPLRRLFASDLPETLKRRLFAVIGTPDDDTPLAELEPKMEYYLGEILDVTQILQRERETFTLKIGPHTEVHWDEPIRAIMNSHALGRDFKWFFHGDTDENGSSPSPAFGSMTYSPTRFLAESGEFESTTPYTLPRRADVTSYTPLVCDSLEELTRKLKRESHYNPSRVSAKVLGVYEFLITDEDTASQLTELVAKHLPRIWKRAVRKLNPTLLTATVDQRMQLHYGEQNRKPPSLDPTTLAEKVSATRTLATRVGEHNFQESEHMKRHLRSISSNVRKLQRVFLGYTADMSSLHHEQSAGATDRYSVERMLALSFDYLAKIDYAGRKVRAASWGLPFTVALREYVDGVHAEVAGAVDQIFDAVDIRDLLAYFNMRFVEKSRITQAAIDCTTARTEADIATVVKTLTGNEPSSDDLRGKKGLRDIIELVGIYKGKTRLAPIYTERYKALQLAVQNMGDNLYLADEKRLYQLIDAKLRRVEQAHMDSMAANSSELGILPREVQQYGEIRDLVHTWCKYFNDAEDYFENRRQSKPIHPSERILSSRSKYGVSPREAANFLHAVRTGPLKAYAPPDFIETQIARRDGLLREAA